MSNSDTVIDLLDGETVEHEAKPSWFAYPYLILLSAVTLIVFVGVFGFVYIWLKRRATRYVVTSDRVVILTDTLFSGRVTKESRISDITYIETGQSSFGKAVGVGTVQVGTSAVVVLPWYSTTLSLKGVPDHDTIAQTIRSRQARRVARGQPQPA